MLIRELDHDWLQYDAVAADAMRESRPPRAAVVLDPGPEYGPLTVGAFVAHVNRVAS